MDIFQTYIEDIKLIQQQTRIFTVRSVHAQITRNILLSNPDGTRLPINDTAFTEIIWQWTQGGRPIMGSVMLSTSTSITISMGLNTIRCWDLWIYNHASNLLPDPEKLLSRAAKERELSDITNSMVCLKQPLRCAPKAIIQS